MLSLRLLDKSWFRFILIALLGLVLWAISLQGTARLSIGGVNCRLSYSAVVSLHGEPVSFELNPMTVSYSRASPTREVKFCDHGSAFFVVGNQLEFNGSRILSKAMTKSQCLQTIKKLDFKMVSRQIDSVEYTLDGIVIKVSFADNMLEDVSLYHSSDCGVVRRLWSRFLAKLGFQ